MKFFRTKKGIIITLAVILLLILIRHIIAENTVFYAPDYAKEELSSILENKDFDAVFRQTGIAPKVAEEIAERENSAFLEKMQKLYFSGSSVKKNYIAFPVTLEERNRDDITPLIPLKKGDILVTYNTRTLDWRHGHSAIVLDDKGEVILEHMSIGEKSVITYAKYWGMYPAFIVLRHPDENIAAAAADYAKENLVGIPYSLFAGFGTKDKTGEENPSSHCSHIVWQAYMSQKEDIDSDGGPVVTPRDIAHSEKLDVVQIFGIDPGKYASRVLK